MYQNPWKISGNIFNSEDIGEYYGMVYLLENTTNGKLYIGKKFFWTHITRQKNGKRKKVKTESDWKKYYGSNKKLKEEIENIGVDKIHRTILKLCYTKTQCAYYEMEEQIKRNVLLDESYYNEFIGGKINGKNLKEI